MHYIGVKGDRQDAMKHGVFLDSKLIHSIS
jgi:hypothetical protein